MGRWRCCIQAPRTLGGRRQATQRASVTARQLACRPRAAARPRALSRGMAARLTWRTGAGRWRRGRAACASWCAAGRPAAWRTSAPALTMWCSVGSAGAGCERLIRPQAHFMRCTAREALPAALPVAHGPITGCLHTRAARPARPAGPAAASKRPRARLVRIRVQLAAHGGRDLSVRHAQPAHVCGRLRLQVGVGGARRSGGLPAARRRGLR